MPVALNGEEIFYGFYPAVERTVTIKGEPMAIYDLMGKDVPLFHYAVTDDDTPHGTQFVETSRQWFDSVWSTIALPVRRMNPDLGRLLAGVGAVLLDFDGPVHAGR